MGLTELIDEIKNRVLDTNKKLFILGIVVAILHTFFEFFAIKNEI